MTRSEPHRLEAARAAGELERDRPTLNDDWLRRLAPTSNQEQRRALLESLSPAMRDAAQGVGPPLRTGVHVRALPSTLGGTH